MQYRISLWTLFFVGLIIDIHKKGGGLKQIPDIKNIVFLCGSLIAVWCFCLILELINNKKLSFAVALIFGVTFYYFKRVASPLSFNVIVNNSDYLFHAAGIKQIADIGYSTFFASDFFWSFTFAMLVYLSYFLKSSIKFEVPRKPMWACLFVGWIAFASMVQDYSHDPFTNFIRSTYHFYFPAKNKLSEIAVHKDLLPEITSKTQFSFREKPNIFLVVVESFNARFIKQRNENGTELTPFFNQLVEKNLYFPNYYSNSIQTTKGQFAALCGQIPLTSGVEFRHNGCFSKKCLPSLLAAENYDTYFIQADPNFQTDNTQKFMLSHGFQHTPEISIPCSAEPHETRCYGLGVKDDIFYDRVFNYLTKEVNPATKKPLFVTLATVFTHMPFSYLTEDERALYKKPKNIKENYLNMLHTTDNSFKTLINRFNNSPWAKNSVLIITGDHGFPTNEHGSSHNENYAYQENFGVPLLIYDPRQDLKKTYSPIENKAFSHLNLGPTILDLAQIETPTDFIANSVFKPTTEEQPVYLVQPYSGGFQAVIHWPYKYIFGAFRGTEKVFNLETDPGEMNRIDESELPEKYKELRTHAAQIYRQQTIFSCEGSESEIMTSAE